MKKFLLMFAVLLAATSAFVLSSCSDDDEPQSKAYVYTVGITKFSGSALNELSQISEIYQKALIKAVGVFDGTISIEGSEKDCDATIRKACESAQSEIEKHQWECSFTYTATQANNNKVVYQYSYPAK